MTEPTYDQLKAKVAMKENHLPFSGNLMAHASEMFQGLCLIKHYCLTTTEADAGRILAHITRLCIDAGVTQHLDALEGIARLKPFPLAKPTD